jgi:hypothetical protein
MAVLFFLSFLVVSGLVIFTIHQYADRKTVRGVRGAVVLLLVFIGWTNAFSTSILLAIDVESTVVARCRAQAVNATDVDCSESSPLHMDPRETLTIWRFLYWLNQPVSWLLIPTMSEYMASGAFTPLGRFKEAIVNQLRYWGVVALIGVLFLVYLLAVRGLTVMALLGFGQALGNVWGLTVLVVLMGYGLVEVPRGLWHKGDRARKMLYYLMRAGQAHDELEEAQGGLAENVDDLKGIMRSLSDLDPLQSCVDTILLSVPKHFDVVRKVASPRTLAARENSGGGGGAARSAQTFDGEVVTEKVLERLHASIREADLAVRTAHSRFRRIVDVVTRLEDIARSEVAAGPAAIHWTERDRRTGFLAPVRDWLEWFWILRVEHHFSRLLAVLAGALSLVVIWCQSTVFVKKPDLSLISVVAHGRETSGLMLQAILVGFVGYMCFCTYATLFRINLFSFYRLTKGGSDPVSLLFNTSMLLRLGLSICYNTLYLLHENAETAFGRIIGNAENLPLVGSFYNKYLPMMVGVICVVAAFNLEGKVLNWLSIRSFSGVSASHPAVEAGRKVVLAEQTRRRNGTEIDVYGHLISKPRARLNHSNSGRGGDVEALELGAIPARESFDRDPVKTSSLFGGKKAPAASVAGPSDLFHDTSRAMTAAEIKEKYRGKGKK